MVIEENNKQQNIPKVQEIGGVKPSFTEPLPRSSVLEQARLFIPIFAESNKHVQKGRCDPEIHPLEKCDGHAPAEDPRCRVEMDVAIGVLEDRDDTVTETNDGQCDVESDTGDKDVLIEELS